MLIFVLLLEKRETLYCLNVTLLKCLSVAVAYAIDSLV